MGESGGGLIAWFKNSGVGVNGVRRNVEAGGFNPYAVEGGMIRLSESKMPRPGEIHFFMKMKVFCTNNRNHSEAGEIGDERLKMFVVKGPLDLIGLSPT